MGFFQDLKEDISQAVNELVPEEMEQISEDIVEIKEEKVIEIDTNPFKAENNIKKEMEEIKEKMQVEKEVYYKAPVEKKINMNAIFDQSANDETANISSGMIIRGEISSQGSLDLMGEVYGDIDVLGKLNIVGKVEGNSKAAEVFADDAKIIGEVQSSGSIKIGQNSVIIGNIFANSAVIAGAVKGDIDVHGPVILDTSAIVMGNIKSKSVQINNGAVIEGMCSQCYADVSPTSFFDDFK
ncbi:MAG: polymer-forming cytoskeletal protein [Lachnospiraceae bacterium]